MNRFLVVGSAALVALAAAAPAVAADVEPVVTPGVFTAPPAFPAARVSRVDGEPVVTPGPFTAPPAFSAARVYNWTGAYVGINGGGAWGRTNWTSVPDGTAGVSNGSGGLFGGTFGYNLQTGEPFVLGAEVDLAWSGISGTVPPLSCAPNCEFRNPWLATARLRFGYAFDGILPYVTAGVAIGRLVADIAGTPFGTERANNLGWTLGAGIEFVISGPWTAKVEYLHADLNGFSCNVACGGGPISFNVSENIVRAGFNYRIWQR
jgi:outer membrane immunogenic protein